MRTVEFNLRILLNKESRQTTCATRRNTILKNIVPQTASSTIVSSSVPICSAGSLPKPEVYHSRKFTKLSCVNGIELRSSSFSCVQYLLGWTLSKVLNFVFNLSFYSPLLHKLSQLVWNMKVPDTESSVYVYRKHKNVYQFPDIEFVQFLSPNL